MLIRYQTSWEFQVWCSWQKWCKDLSLRPEMLSCGRVQDTAATQTLIWSAASERISPETFSYFFPKNQIYFLVDQLEAMLVSLSHASLESKTMKRVHLNATILSNWKHPLKSKNSELHFGGGEAIAINYSPENGIPAGAASSQENSISKRTRQLNPIIWDHNRNSSWTLWLIN